MKRKLKTILTIAISSATIISCGSSRESQNLKENLAMSGKQCFEYYEDGNLISLQASFTNGVVIGELAYEWAEKDQNHGILEGRMTGDTLLANYTFRSEGKKSERQVAFIFKDSILYEGYGERVEKDSAMVFKDPSTLTFSETFPLVLVDCEGLEEHSILPE